MQHTNYPNKCAWNPLSRSGITPSGFVACSFYNSPYLRAVVWNPTSGATATYTSSTSYKLIDLTTRKQGGWVVGVPSHTTGIVLYSFDKASGFGSESRVLEGSDFNGAAFSRDGDKLLLSTSSSLKMYSFSKSGLGSELALASTSVSGITSVSASFDFNTYIVVGTGGGVEIRSFDNLSSSGSAWSGSSLGALKFGALSGLMANGYRYWAVGQKEANDYAASDLWFGRLTGDNAFGTAYKVNVNTDKTRKVFSVAFCENRNAMLVGQNTNDNDTDNPGNDLHSWLLGSTLQNETGPPSGSYDGQRATNGNARGGAPWSLLCIPGTDSVVAGLGYGWNNTRGLDAASIAANGSLSGLSDPASMGSGVDGLDWF